MKKLVAILLSLAMVLSLAACGSKTPASTEAPKPGESTAAPQAAWPKGNIDIIVPFKAGGAMDLSARLTADYLKKYLNVEVTVQNVEGGANWVGYNQILAAKGDGYTLLLSAPGDDIICKSLGRTCHHIFIHAVGTRSDDPPKSGCTEFQIGIKTLPDLRLISCNGLKLLRRFFIKEGTVHPLLICLHIVSHILSLLNLIAVILLFQHSPMYCSIIIGKCHDISICPASRSSSFAS